MFMVLGLQCCGHSYSNVSPPLWKENAYPLLKSPPLWCTSSNHRSTFIYVITWEMCRAHEYHLHVLIGRDQAKIFSLKFWYFHLDNLRIFKHRIYKICTFLSINFQLFYVSRNEVTNILLIKARGIIRTHFPSLISKWWFKELRKYIFKLSVNCHIFIQKA